MDEKLLTYYLHPSGIFAHKTPHLVTTVLGSCISVCLFDPQVQLGGINHFMLPLWNGEGLESPRYGNVAIKKLIAEMESMGASKNRIVAKIFGGGRVLGDDIYLYHIGERNIAIAYKLLDEMGIQVIASSTGGDRGRKIIFNTGTGEVFQKYLNKRQ